MDEPLLELRSVSFEGRDHRVLDSVSLRVARGAKTFVLGYNGAGKSVLLRVMHGLLAPTYGNVTWHGGKRIEQAMVFQRPVMLRRPVLDNVAYPLIARGMARSQAHAKASEVLRRVGLARVESRFARLLSGGEQQRVALARAWLLKPDVLFLDEPTANLDPGATREVEHIIEEMHRAGTTIVMTTHNRGQARRLAHDIVFLDAGKLMECTQCEQFFSAPQSAAAQHYLKGDFV
ncbi:MAG: ATP-binding cassette domain-containing protein [Burkholderiaceae bacterium]